MKQYFSFQWHITDECDQRCRYCYIFSEDNGKKPDAMTWEQMQDVVDNCCDMCEMYDRLPYFYLTGGDPILHPDFWRLLGLLRERDIPFTIMGNPFHLNDEICKRLKSYGCQKYQLSLDGMRETHDWFRKPGSFDCTLEKIACIKNAGIHSVIMTTVSGANIKEVPKIIDTVVQYEADIRGRRLPQRKAPQGRARQNCGIGDLYDPIRAESISDKADACRTARVSGVVRSDRYRRAKKAAPFPDERPASPTDR